MKTTIFYYNKGTDAPISDLLSTIIENKYTNTRSVVEPEPV